MRLYSQSAKPFLQDRIQIILFPVYVALMMQADAKFRLSTQAIHASVRIVLLTSVNISSYLLFNWHVQPSDWFFLKVWYWR